MQTTPSFREDHISQVPALQLLINMGYTYLTPAAAYGERREKTSNLILEKKGLMQKLLTGKVRVRVEDY